MGCYKTDNGRDRDIGSDIDDDTRLVTQSHPWRGAGGQKELHIDLAKADECQHLATATENFSRLCQPVEDTPRRRCVKRAIGDPCLNFAKGSVFGVHGALFCNDARARCSQTRLGQLCLGASDIQFLTRDHTTLAQRFGSGQFAL